ncbi:MAG TPA: Wzz/FepE/Etk N-terminal domain-containing protein, partial [Chloroflexota bacterium]|nr:Wzz/FepE/Etk N-terminal domain-containing protein [Chloroflexota bacterium]
MELRAFWNVLVRWRWVVLLVTGAAVIASGVLAAISPPGYKALTIVSFSAPPASTAPSIPGLDEQNRMLSAEQVVEDFTKIVPTYGFAIGVAKRLDFPADPLQLARVWTVKKQAHHLLSIEASGPTEQRAVELARAAAEEITANGQSYYKDLNSSDLEVAVPDPAHSEGLSGRLLDIIFIAARVISGLIVGIGLAFLLNYVDDRINGPDDVELLGLRV